MLRRWQRRLRYWLHSSERARLLREEMEIHLEMKIQELMEDGMTEQDARGAARRQFGNATLQQEEARGTWIARWLSDLGAGLRLCRPNPPPAAGLRRRGHALGRAGHRRLLADFRDCELCPLPAAGGGRSVAPGEYFR